jgi:hypothetical protein
MANETKKGTTPKDWQTALDIQSACNASGLIASLNEMKRRIWEDVDLKLVEAEGFNDHPIVKLFVHQLCGLTIKEEPMNWDYWKAHNEAERRAKG